MTSFIGKRFSKLTVVEEFKKGKYLFCKCKCDCGVIKDIARRALTQKNGTVSCGCQKKINIKINQMIGAQTKLKKTDQAKYSLISYYKSNSKRRNIEFNLTDEQFFKLTKDNCFYCNREPSNIQRRRRSIIQKTHEYYTYNGIDRVDNSIGYQINNCVACCIICNQMKMDFSLEDFYNQIEKIYKNKVVKTI